MNGRKKIFLHVGPMKTGSTTLQRILWKNRDSLLADGVLIPGRRQVDHFNIGRDVRQLPPVEHHPDGDWTGSLDEAIAEIENSDAGVAILSDEHFAQARQGDIERLYSRLAGFDVEIIYAMREFAGLLSSQWQERVKHQLRVEAFDEWLREVRDQRPRHLFWRQHDTSIVIPRWTLGYQVPIHLLAVPARGAPRDEMWHRLQGIVGWKVETDTAITKTNESLGAAEADLLRRIQQRLDPKPYDIRRKRILLRYAVREVLLRQPDTTPILLPPEYEPWCREMNAERRGLLNHEGVTYHGSTNDLDDVPGRFGEVDVDDLATRQRDAAVEVIAHIASAYAAEWQQRAEAAPPASDRIRAATRRLGASLRRGS